MKSKIKQIAAALAITLLLGGCKGNPETPSNIVVSVTDSTLGTSAPASSSLQSSTQSYAGVFSSNKASSASDTVSIPVNEPESSDNTQEIIIGATSEYYESSSQHGETSTVSSSRTTVSSSRSSSASSSSSTSAYSSSSSSSTGSSTAASSSGTTPEVPDTPTDPIQARIAQMSLREKVYQMFFVTPEQLGGRYPVTTPMDISDRPVGGILCMGANLETVSQTRNMLTKTQENAKQNGIGVFLAVDEEGGKVARCAYKLGTTAFEGMAVYGVRNNYDEAHYIGAAIGTDLRSLGFNVDFAPVADVDISPTNELGDRIFSSDPEVCANMVSGVVRGLNSTGVAATLKHFPGLGAEDGNTHTASAIIINRTLSELRETEFVPFRSGIRAGADFVMIGHQQVSAFGDGLPADLSYTAVTELLRGELGFNGIAITDAQNMNTISNVYYPGTAAVLSVKAGIDMILSPADLDSAANAVISAVNSGEISEERINESVTRILTVKQHMGLFD